MTSKTYAQLTAQTTLAASDLLAAWRPSGPGPLKSITGTVLIGFTDGYYLRLDGSTAMTSTLLWYTGAQSTPGLAISGDPDTGFYGVAANDIGLSVGGVQVSHWNSSGQAVTGALDVSGVITSPTISAAATSLSQISSSLSSTASTTTNLSSSLSGVSSTLTNVSSSVTNQTNVSSSLSQVSSSLSQTNTSTANNSTSIANVATSLGNVSTSLANVNTSLGNVSTSLSSTASTVAAIAFPMTVVTKSADYTTILSDANKCINQTQTGKTITIDATLAYVAGTIIEVVSSGGTNTLAITGGTLRWNNSAGSRTLGQDGSAGVRFTGGTTWRVVYAVGIS
jgi:hypothetical protein